MTEAHDVDLEGAGVSKPKRKLFILLGVAVGGGALAAGVLLATGVLGGGAAAEAAAKTPGAGGDAEGAAADAGAPTRKGRHDIKTIEIKPFAVNLADEDKNRFARVGLAFVVPKDADLDQFNELIPLIQGATIPIFMGCDSTKLRDPQGLQEVRAQLTQAAKKADPSHTLLEVSIYELVIQ